MLAYIDHIFVFSSLIVLKHAKIAGLFRLVSHLEAFNQQLLSVDVQVHTMMSVFDSDFEIKSILAKLTGNIRA